MKRYTRDALLIASLAAGCADPSPQPGAKLERNGDEIVVAGELFHTGTPVVLWLDSGGYDAYRPHRHFTPDTPGPREHPERLARYGSFRGGLDEDLAANVRRRGWTLEELQKTVTQVVIHFDACGTSRRCFEVLHDIRGLSCHFLLDLDGTVYQTLDLKERAWHAAQANDRSIGIEIANIGAYATEEALEEWYKRDDDGVRIELPGEPADSGLPTDFVARPRRGEVQRGTINHRDLVQYDFTEEQYRALERLLVTLCRVFPRIRALVPRDPDGQIKKEAFASDEELLAFAGIIGHWHVTTAKVDPGPALDWQRLLDALEEAGVGGG